MKIVVLTADENNGGIKQFTFQILRTLLDIGHEAVLFIPDIKSIKIPEDCIKNVVRYRKQKDILGITPAIIGVAKQINGIEPDRVFLTDDSMYSIQIIRHLKKNINILMTMHDITSHPAKISLKRRILRFISTKIYRKIAFNRVNSLVALSDNSKNRLITLYPTIASKIIVVKLGAHPPVISEETNPFEIDKNECARFVLFFGRIQKYKGVLRAINAFNAVTNKQNFKLVIAGTGSFSQEEKNSLNNSESIIVINRFIKDEEMIWLLKNASFVVLPYIEASQSGVIPLAYHVGTPVIASNIDGIREFVNEETGLLFDNDDELTKIFENICSGSLNANKYASKCKEYEKLNLDWKNNLIKAIK